MHDVGDSLAGHRSQNRFGVGDVTLPEPHGSLLIGEKAQPPVVGRQVETHHLHPLPGQQVHDP